MKTVLEIRPDISYKSTGKFEETRFEKIQPKPQELLLKKLQI